MAAGVTTDHGSAGKNEGMKMSKKPRGHDLEHDEGELTPDQQRALKGLERLCRQVLRQVDRLRDNMTRIDAARIDAAVQRLIVAGDPQRAEIVLKATRQDVKFANLTLATIEKLAGDAKNEGEA